MATLRDSALSAAGNATAVNTVATADQLSWQIGDAIEVTLKGEGAVPSSVTIDTGASTPTFTIANPLAIHSGNNDLWLCTAYWIATSAGLGNPRAVLGSSATRPYMELRAISKIPAAGKTWALGTGGAAPVVAQGNGTLTPATAAVTLPGAGSSFIGLGLYATRVGSSSATYSVITEFPGGSAHIGYRNVATGETVTPTITYASPTTDYIIQSFYLQEVDPGGTTQNLAGAATGSGAATGAAAVTKPLAGGATGGGAATGALGGTQQNLAGGATGGGAAAGAASIGKPLAGGATGGAAAAGQLQGGATITTVPLKNDSGSLLTALTIEKLVALRVSDLTLIASWANQTTNGSGVLSLTHPSLVAGVSYLLVTCNADGSARGVRPYTAA